MYPFDENVAQKLFQIKESYSTGESIYKLRLRPYNYLLLQDLNWDNIVCLNLYIFWAQSHLCLLLQNTFFCKSKQEIAKTAEKEEMYAKDGFR